MATVTARLHLGAEVTSVDIVCIVNALEESGFSHIAVNEVWNGSRHHGFELDCRRTYTSLHVTPAARAHAVSETRDKLNNIVNGTVCGAIQKERYLLSLSPVSRA